MDNSPETLSYRPKMSTETACDLVRDLYGLHVLSCRELDSYDDRNFHVTVDSKGRVHNDHLHQVWPHGYVLKVLNSQDSKKPEIIEAKNALLMAAAEKGFPTPKLIPSVTGQMHCMQPLVSEQNGQKDGTEGEQKAVYLIRLMEYLPGTVLASIPLTPHISFQVGQYAATLDLALKDFNISNCPELVVDWNMQTVPSLRKLTRFIEDVNKTNVVNDVIEAFETRVLNSQNGLQTGFIHSDFNDYNILVEPENTEGERSSSPNMRVCGILDFGDSTKSFYIIEIAIAMTYMTLMCPPDLNPDQMCGHALAGYLSVINLTKVELELLPLTMCARFCQSLVNGFHRLVLDPDNAYCLVHANKVWPHLHRLWTRPMAHTLDIWKAVAEEHGITLNV